MKLHLHHCHDSRSARTAWLLEELGLPYDMTVHVFGPDLQAPDYLSKSPAGRVPCLEIDGVAYTESGAIAEILCEAHPTSLFRSPGHAERNKWLEWLHFSETMGQLLANLTQQHIVLYPEARSVGVMKLERRRLEKLLAIVDRSLAGQDYLLPGGFSAADIAVGYSVDIARRFAPTEPFENLTGYHARITARDAFQRIQPEPDAPRIYIKDFYELPEI